MVSKASLRQIQKLPKIPEVLVKGETDSALVQENDRVFVIPSGPLKNQNMKKDFRMAQVLEIRGRSREDQSACLLLQFLYGLRDVPENNELAPTELILSNQEEWHPLGSIIDNMGDFFRIFDDSIPNPPRMNSQIWFYRPTHSLCPKCNGQYLPHRDRQRFCHPCKKWFHLKCVDVPVRPRQDRGDGTMDYDEPDKQRHLDIEGFNFDGFPAILEEVLEMPTVRGHRGDYDFDNNWLTTGSGVQKGLINKWFGKDSELLPTKWLEELGEDFLEDFVIDKTWKFYQCPLCGLEV